jgi:PTH1 family peptidyl-tRNA hydrolase
MKLVVGLGNPGPKYDLTRHNVGFEVLDRFARRYAAGAIARSRFHGALLETTVDDEKVLLLKPTTFMNRSGQAVAEAVRFYKLDVQDALLVIVDDVALPCGSIRLRSGGGTGGHNGLADVEQHLGTSDYPRMRIGIDAPGQIPQVEYVLGRFRPDQRELLEPALDDAVAATADWIRLGTVEAMNRHNRRNSA